MESLKRFFCYADGVKADLQTEFGQLHPSQSSAGMQRLRAWLSLPDEDRAELINGQIVYKAMPTIAHGSAIGEIFGEVRRSGGGPVGQGGGGWWLSTDPDLLLAGQGMRPDVVGWRADRYPQLPQKVDVGEHKGVYVAVPDWACEVLSPSTQHRDELDGAKGLAYFRAGVTHYWLVDLDAEQIAVYRRGEREYEAIAAAGFESVAPLPPFESIPFEARRVFLTARAQKSRR